MRRGFVTRRHLGTEADPTAAAVTRAARCGAGRGKTPRRAAGRHWLVAALTASALVAVACSEPPTTGSGNAVEIGGGAQLPDCPLDALDEATGPVEVNLWYGGLQGSTKATMEDIVARFNASQDKVRLTANDQGAAYEEIFRKYESASATPEQLPDLIYLEDTQLQAMIDGGQVLPAQACMKAAGYDPTDIEPVARSKYTVDDVLYPGYMNVSTPVLYYNKAHMVKAGLDPDDPPQTLDEIHTQAKALKDAGVSEKPLSFRISRWFFETWLTGIGEDIVNNGDGREAPATEATFATPEADDLVGWLKKMNDEGLLNAFANTEGSIDQYLALATQQSSMLIETSAASATIADALGANVTAAEAGIDFDASVLDKTEVVPGAAAMPGIESPGKVFPTGGAFYILNTSEPARQAASWKFLEFMLRPEIAKIWHMNGAYLPIVKAVEDDPEVQAFWKDQLAGVLLKPAVDQLDDADPDQPGPLIGPYVDEALAIENALDAVLFDNRDVADSLTHAQDEVTQSLERYAGD
jgi:sn-glycerol 3-phosphate transport system substrate-binding protein